MTVPPRLGGVRRQLTALEAAGGGWRTPLVLPEKPKFLACSPACGDTWSRYWVEKLRALNWTRGTPASLVIVCTPNGLLKPAKLMGVVPQSTTKATHSKAVLHFASRFGVVTNALAFSYPTAKGEQEHWWRSYFRSAGCSWQEKRVAPEQYILSDVASCRAFVSSVGGGAAGSHATRQVAAVPTPVSTVATWLTKPLSASHGRGIAIHTPGEAVGLVRGQSGNCTRPVDSVIMQYVDSPALIKGHKFGLRTYFLVASLEPTLVFYHEGYAARSDTPFVAAQPGAPGRDRRKDASYYKAHVTNAEGQVATFYSLKSLRQHLSNEFVDAFSVYAPKITAAIARAGISFSTTARAPHTLSPSSFNFFAIDWVVERRGDAYRPHFLELNAFPMMIEYKDAELTPAIYHDTIDLLLQCQQDYLQFAGAEIGHRFRRYELVVNGMADVSMPYNACTAVPTWEEHVRASSGQGNANAPK